MRGRFSLVLGMLVVASVLAKTDAARAEPPKLKIEVPPPSGQYLSFTPDTDAKSIVYVGLDGVDPFPTSELKDPRRFLLSTRGLAEGKYRFAAIAASATGEQTRVDFVVVIGPGSDPNIPPPPPKDKLLEAVRAAYDKDTSTTKKADMAALAEVYLDLATKVKDANTVRTTGHLADLIVNTRKKKIGDRLQGVRDVFGEELSKLNLPEAANAMITPGQREAVSRLLA